MPSTPEDIIMNKLIMLLVLGIWIGLVLGLSFIEAPLKFQAPGITIKLGLGIGRLVFGALNKIEIGFSILLLITCSSLFKELGNLLKGMFLVLLLIVFVQSLFLLPALDERAELILSGQQVASTAHHLMYVILEVVKLILLFFLFVKSYQLQTVVPNN